MKILIPIILAFAFTPVADAADPANGAELHAKSCTACHDASLYTRANKRVQSLPGLGTQVRFCKNNLGIAWFDDEVEDVVAYLNENYYHY